MDYLLYGCVLLSFVLGYVVGRLDFIVGRLGESAGAPHQSTLRSHLTRKTGAAGTGASFGSEKIDINSATVVTNIDTGGMQRSGAKELGKTTVAKDDIQSSVSKLAQLKGK